MAITDAYATAAEYRTGISPNKTDTSADAEILLDITAVTRYLERKLRRFFGKDAAAVARDFYARSGGPIYPEAENPYKFAGKRSRTLDLDTDLVSITSVVVDDNGDGTPETVFTATDYQLLPLNADKGPEPSPYNALYIPEWSTQLGWPTGRMVRITGVWGWPAVPASIKRGTIQLTAILRLESPRATSTVNDAGSVIEMSKEGRGIVRELMRSYARASF